MVNDMMMICYTEDRFVNRNFYKKSFVPTVSDEKIGTISPFDESILLKLALEGWILTTTIDREGGNKFRYYYFYHKEMFNR